MSRCRLFRVPIVSGRGFCSIPKPKPASGTIRSTPDRGIGMPSSSNLELQAYLRQASSKDPIETVPLSTQLNELFAAIKESYHDTPFSTKLFYGSFLGLFLFGDALDRRYVEYSNPNGVYSFLAESPEDTIMNLCSTGDVIVFQRPIFSFNPVNMLRTSLRQFACGGPWDHCGIIVHNGHDNNFPFVVEIDQNHKNQLRITPFDERVLTAREQAIFVRQIQKNKISQESKEKFSDWIDFKVNGPEDYHNENYIEEVEQFMERTPHERDSMFSILIALCLNGDNTVKIRSAIRDLTRKIRQNEYEMMTQVDNKGPVQQPIGMMKAVHHYDKRHGRVKSMDDLIKETRCMKLQRALKRDNLKKREKKIREWAKINSSQFVGLVWRYLEILEEDGAKPWEIRPQQFADSKIEIPMVGTTRLGLVQFVKTANEDGKINDSERRYRGTKQNSWEKTESQMA